LLSFGPGMRLAPSAMSDPLRLASSIPLCGYFLPPAYADQKTLRQLFQRAFPFIVGAKKFTA
jgi:hypothetical protein